MYQVLFRIGLANMTETLGFTSALTIRNELPPATWEPHCEEGETEMMKSVIATYNYRHLVDVHKAQGRDFTKHTYIPAVDPITGKKHKEQEDHNHIEKRIGKHVREGEIPNVGFGMFREAVDAKAITDAILLELRKQSVGDADERLLSYLMVDFFKGKGYISKEKFV